MNIENIYLLIVPSILYYFHSYSQTIYNYILSYFIVNFTFTESDVHKFDFERWIELNVKKYEIVNFYASDNKFVPSNFKKLFLYQKIPIMVNYTCISSNQISSSNQMGGSKITQIKQIVITSLNITNIEFIVKEFMKDIYIRDKIKGKENIILFQYIKGCGWVTDVLISFDDISYIQSNEKKYKYLDIISADYEKFMLKDEFYKKRNIAHKRCYLLHGPPGTGKTALIKNFAFKNGMNIYNIVPDKTTKTEDISRMLKIINRTKAVIILEDVNSLFSKDFDITLSGLLNIFDGIGMNDKIIFMTTNYPERLDSSFIRPGRVDFKLKIDYSDRTSIYNMITDYRPDICKKDKNKLVNTIFQRDDITIAEVQSYLLYHLDSDIEVMLNAWNDFNKLQNCFKFESNSDSDTCSIQSETSIISR